MTCEPIRIIQHLSCTGGTLFSKCIAAMPNTVLFSEINPLSTQLFLGGTAPKYCPTDVIALARIGKAPAINELSEKIFLADMRVVVEHLSVFGKQLVLREHSHSSFLVRNNLKNPKTMPMILDGHFQCLSIITVRNPIDSYLSLKHNGWLHFTPGSFDEYCQRCLKFLSCNPNAPIFKYEHLVDNPANVMQEICSFFDITYNNAFQHILEEVGATGDSGRRSNVIGRRKRREIDQEFVAEANASENFKTLRKLLNYESI